ncbi:glycerate kinase family protein [Actinomadura rudentiformis]|uniref:Glycerate kinase n=1 Tax=Actinomadura rudentiformis TaxID=359158 RepID=A0A6H9Z4B8_9ACTN|nr:glycerate kinase [Actinomadura rudentiformis]KAB2348352.1 glycerate kinase [Actinomadura rudentiformis]
MAVRVICAPDKLRGSLDAAEAAAALAAGVRAAGGRPVEHPLADGGEGSRGTVQEARGGTVLDVESVDAFGRPWRAKTGRLDDGTAIVEAAEAVGWGALAEGERDPMRASSAGLAAPLLAAAGDARRVVVFLGGTATMDGGTGLLAALGAEILDGEGRRLSGSGADLARVHSIDLAPARERLKGVELLVAADVVSPLYGPNGAARVFGPQKGADPDMVEVLDDGLRRLAPLLGVGSGRGDGADAAPGGGAAGGLGAALLALGARMKPGAVLIRELTRFDELLVDADLCLTAEGKVDASTDAGKTIRAVVDACAEAQVPCVVLGGTLTADAQRLYERGATAVLSVSPGPRDLDTALREAGSDLTATAYAVCRMMRRNRPGSG